MRGRHPEIIVKNARWLVLLPSLFLACGKGGHATDGTGGGTSGRTGAAGGTGGVAGQGTGGTPASAGRGGAATGGAAAGDGTAGAGGTMGAGGTTGAGGTGAGGTTGTGGATGAGGTMGAGGTTGAAGNVATGGSSGVGGGGSGGTTGGAAGGTGGGGAVHDRCADPQRLELVNGQVTVSDDTKRGTDEFPTVTCGGVQMPATLGGPQLYYEFTVREGFKYELRIKAGGYSSTVLYIFPAKAACTADAIQAACTSGGETGLVASAISNGGMIPFAPRDAGDYIVGIDTYQFSTGPFTLTIFEYCGTAAAPGCKTKVCDADTGATCTANVRTSATPTGPRTSRPTARRPARPVTAAPARRRSSTPFRIRTGPRRPATSARGA